MNEIKLLPCPFCGGEAFMLKNKGMLETYRAYCGNEDCSVSPRVSAYSKEIAVKLWNTRKPMQEIVERLEEKANELRRVRHSLSLSMCSDEKDDNKVQKLVQKEIGMLEAIEIVKEVGGLCE